MRDRLKAWWAQRRVMRVRRRWDRGLFPAVALVLLLAACDNEADTTPPPSTETAGEYVQALEWADIEVPDPEVAVTLGRSLCDSWDQGSDFDTSVQVMTDQGLTATDAGSIMGAAAVFLCPDHLQAAQAWAD